MNAPAFPREATAVLEAALASARSSFAVYALELPIYFGWQYARPVVEVLTDWDAERESQLDFLLRYTQAELAARTVGYSGAVSAEHPPAVFAVPMDTLLVPGFVFKGPVTNSTFVCAPRRIPHLESVSKDLAMVEVAGHEARRLRY